ncbi:AMP-binding protein [Humitalea sp. 24SJ18S-53]|uniref:AMP-binding protein n=1 Tax=Humitalea sp. 24SJ18S-53 TaxID=3422307 RepID=UPI003D67981B
MTLTALLEASAARAPDALALVAADGGGRVTWSGFVAAARRLAMGFARQGIGPGDRVALWCPNRPEHLIAQFALARLGAATIHINTRFVAADVAGLLDRARPSAVVAAFGFPGMNTTEILAEILPDTRAPLRFILGLDAGGIAEIAGVPVLPWAELDASPERHADDSAPDALCLTFTTSGTTAGPKLVAHTQAAIATHARDVAARTGTGEADAAVLAIVPLCGTFGLSLAMAGIAGGARIVTMARFDAAAADTLIREQKITHMVGGDDLLLRLAEAAGGRPHAPFLFTGFASFHPGADRVVDICGALNMAPRGVYGSSECQALFALQDPADPIRCRIGGGTPASGAAGIRARDIETGLVAEAGELEFSGPSLFMGYLGDPAATARARTADGWFRSGDFGRMHPGAGFDYETRLGDALRLGGFLVAPEEIEAFLKQQPGVAEAQVVGARGGSIAVAFVSGDAPDPVVLAAACTEHLARFKQPSRIIPIDAFPVTDGPNGQKIQRGKLREMAEAALAAEMAQA